MEAQEMRVFFVCCEQVTALVELLVEVYPFLQKGRFYKDQLDYQLGVNDEATDSRIGFLFETERTDEEMGEAVIGFLLNSGELTEAQLSSLIAHFENRPDTEE